jgi:hypothetical protein
LAGLASRAGAGAGGPGRAFGLGPFQKGRFFLKNIFSAKEFQTKLQ